MLTDALYWASADALALAARLATARDLPSADVLQRRIVTLLEEMERKAVEGGVSREDVHMAKYAIVAFIDEQISRSPWPGKQQWTLEPLQLVLFNENTAGEGFYQRLSALENDPSRVHVLQIFYLCLQLGFQGIYAVRGAAGLAAVTEGVMARVTRAINAGDAISPHGLPPDAGRSVVRRQAPLFALAAALFVLSAVAFVGLRVVLSMTVSSATKTIETQTARVGGGAKLCGSGSLPSSCSPASGWADTSCSSPSGSRSSPRSAWCSSSSPCSSTAGGAQAPRRARSSRS